MLLLGIIVIGLPLLFAWGLIGTTFLEIRYMLAQGTESTANVADRDTDIRRSRGRVKERRRSVLHFDGYWGTVSFWVEPNSVPVIYDDTKDSAKSHTYRAVVIGRKSDGFVSVLHQNEGIFVWVPVAFWSLVNLFSISFGALLVVTGLGLRAQYQKEPPDANVSTPNSPSLNLDQPLQS